jgi:hypothetical protein
MRDDFSTALPNFFGGPEGRVCVTFVFLLLASSELGLGEA